MARGAVLIALLCLSACGGRRALPAGGADEATALPGLDHPPPAGTDWGPARWQCETKSDGRHFCQKLWPNTGLPPFGSGWLCHLATHLAPPRWICHGAAATPVGTAWSCSQPDPSTTRCEKADAVDSDRPPDAGTWVCVKGTVYGGSLCEQVTDRNPPLIYGGPCFPGQRLWCDGQVYDGWGQVECDPTIHRWRTRVVNGKELIDCDESLAGGKLPLTRCALHHPFFFTPRCCERTDCIVPDGTKGQPYAKSPGGFCDPCNPQSPKCAEPGAKCVVTEDYETFCGRLCSDTAPCPNGFNCVDVKYTQGGTRQCVPQDLSCYF